MCTFQNVKHEPPNHAFTHRYLLLKFCICTNIITTKSKHDKKNIQNILAFYTWKERKQTPIKILFGKVTNFTISLLLDLSYEGSSHSK